MKLGIKPVDAINMRLATARLYLHTVGWTAGTHGEKGEPTDLVGALQHCAERDGWEVISARLLAARGFDTAWNDLQCANLFEALQALDVMVTNEECERVYGRNWHALVGIVRLFSSLTRMQLDVLAQHIGPADEPAILSLLARTGDNPCFEDAALVLMEKHALTKRTRMMTDALVAFNMTFPDMDDRVSEIVAPIAEKLGLG